MESSAPEERGPLLDVQKDAGSQEDGCGQVGAWRERNVAGGAGTAVDSGLDGGGVVVNAISGGAEVGDREGDRFVGSGDRELDCG